MVFNYREDEYNFLTSVVEGLHTLYHGLAISELTFLYCLWVYVAPSLFQIFTTHFSLDGIRAYVMLSNIQYSFIEFFRQWPAISKLLTVNRILIANNNFVIKVI